jgi:hypothetical protein
MAFCASPQLLSVLGSATLDGYGLPCCGSSSSSSSSALLPGLACVDRNMHGAAGVRHDAPRGLPPVIPEQCKLSGWEGDYSAATACGLAQGVSKLMMAPASDDSLAFASFLPSSASGLRDAGLGYATTAQVSPLPSFSNDDTARRETRCVWSVRQQHMAARNFREAHADIAQRFRVECMGDATAPTCKTEQFQRSYDRARDLLQNATEEVVRQCLPRAAEPASVDGLAAGVLRLAAIPGGRPGAAEVTEDPRRCAARVDLARHMCSVLPQRLLAPRSAQLQALCGVDVPSMLAGRLGDPEPADWQRLRDALQEGDLAIVAQLMDQGDVFRFGPEDDPLGSAAQQLRQQAAQPPQASPWCPVMMREAARELEALRERFVVNPALGRGERIMCGNLGSASACLGAGAEADDGAAGRTDVPPPPSEEDPGASADFEIARRARPGQRPANAQDRSDTVNVFADLLDPSENNKPAVASKLGSIVEAVRGASGVAVVERLSGDEIVANTGAAEQKQHQNVCFVHCHARTAPGLAEVDGGLVQRSRLNCRLYTPPDPSQTCRRAVISVVDETEVAEGTNLRARDSPAYDLIEGVLSQFHGCNVRRGGTEAGVPAQAVNVRMGPFQSERWAGANARYGFCYVERDQLASLTATSQPEIVQQLHRHRQPSGNYMLAFASSHARQGGRMAQRECKMLLDLHQNVCRQRFATKGGLNKLPGYGEECMRKPVEEVVGTVGIPVEVTDPSCGLPECPSLTMTQYVELKEFPRKACELQKIAEACGTITSFSAGEPESGTGEALREMYGVPDSIDAHCRPPKATARSGAASAATRSGAASAGVPAEVGLQTYLATGWHEHDMKRDFEKRSLAQGCEATCIVEHDHKTDKAGYDKCVEECYADMGV